MKTFMNVIGIALGATAVWLLVFYIRSTVYIVFGI